MLQMRAESTKLQYVKKGKKKQKRAQQLVKYCFFYPKRNKKITEKEYTLILELMKKLCNAC